MGVVYDLICHRLSTELIAANVDTDNSGCCVKNQHPVLSSGTDEDAWPIFSAGFSEFSDVKPCSLDSPGQKYCLASLFFYLELFLHIFSTFF